jgi:hypothetical protein
MQLFAKPLRKVTLLYEAGVAALAVAGLLRPDRSRE